MHQLCLVLRLDHQLRGEQALSLILRYMRTIDDVSDKLRAEGQIQVVAVDITCLLSIDNKEVVSRLLNRNIGIFSELDVALRSENEEPPIAPRAQSVGSKPVQANVSQAAVAAQHHIAEVLKARTVGMIDVGNLRRNDLGFGRSRVIKKLIDLIQQRDLPYGLIVRKMDFPSSAALDEARKADAEGKSRVVLFNLSGHGHFDLGAYDQYFAGRLEELHRPSLENRG